MNKIDTFECSISDVDATRVMDILSSSIPTFLIGISDSINKKYIIQQFKNVLQIIKDIHYPNVPIEGSKGSAKAEDMGFPIYTMYEFIYIDKTIITIFKFSIYRKK